MSPGCAQAHEHAVADDEGIYSIRIGIHIRYIHMPAIKAVAIEEADTLGNRYRCDSSHYNKWDEYLLFHIFVVSWDK